MSLLIIDLGGQYCHLIKRTLGDFDIAADIRGPQVTAQQANHYTGIILSGGPQSVYEKDSPTIDSELLELDVPILGICYGHQLLARMLGGTVEAVGSEYGPTLVTFIDKLPLFADFPLVSKAWMSHGDSVTSLPNGLTLNAMSVDCPVVAFSDPRRRFFGVQFHPEVAHTDLGSNVLKNFADMCGEEPHGASDHIEHIITNIKNFVGDRKVFFFVSGGVDSTVAFVLCAKALPKDQLRAAYVDTGFMRKSERHDLVDCFSQLGLDDCLITIDWSKDFMDALTDVAAPEQKREIIGRLFVEIQSTTIAQYIGDDWLLGQGTIYPDVIESGVGSAAKIKTHHNRCAEIRELIEKDLVIEPLRDLYKDQVRDIGHQLGIPRHFIDRWPFPGPGLAIRCLCAPCDGILLPVEDEHFLCARMPLRSVGVQGDQRSYRTTMAARGPLRKRLLNNLSHRYQDDRIILQLAGPDDLAVGRVVRAMMTSDRINLLREADHIVQNEMRGREALVWQFPVVLIPLSFGDGESIVLRPVGSRDGMTANFVIPPPELLNGMIERIMKLPGVDAVFLDISDKPPATIEWE